MAPTRKTRGVRSRGRGKLVKLGFAVAAESSAGEAANCADGDYRAAGAEVLPGAADVWARADIVFKVRPPTLDEVGMLREGATLIGFVWPAQHPELMEALQSRKATVLAIDCLPRQLSRAQKMDALSSMAGISGYRAVVEAANAFGRFFNGQITAAGKIPPAKVFIAGVGVAGLAAIGTAANLGAIVRANDTRAEVADQVVSLGGTFVKVDYEEEGSGGGGYAKVMSEGFLAKALPESFSQLTEMRHLQLGSNYIGKVPEQIRGFSALKYLHLGNNDITALPEWIGDFARLEYLTLHKNIKLRALDALAGQKTLKVLNLYLVSLGRLPNCIYDLGELTTLTLWNVHSISDDIARLSNLEFFTDCGAPMLRELRLDSPG